MLTSTYEEMKIVLHVETKIMGDSAMSVRFHNLIEVENHFFFGIERCGFNSMTGTLSSVMCHACCAVLLGVF